MGKVHKVCWPKGKNLKPAPRRMAPVQAIPGPRRKSEEERRKKLDYQLAISQGLYPPGAQMDPPMMQTAREIEILTPLLRRSRPFPATSTNTVALISTPGMAAVAMSEMISLLAATPAPSREPIEVTEAQYQALMDLPVAETPEELAAMASTFGTAVLMVR